MKTKDNDRRKRLDQVPAGSTIVFEYDGRILEGCNYHKIFSNQNGWIKVYIYTAGPERTLFLSPDTQVEVI